MTYQVKVSDWDQYPSGRYKKYGPASGEAFRDDVLQPALLAYEEVSVDMDDVLGFGSSWLEEAFGGLVRVHGHDGVRLLERLSFVGGVKSDEALARLFIREAHERKS